MRRALGTRGLPAFRWVPHDWSGAKTHLQSMRRGEMGRDGGPTRRPLPPDAGSAGRPGAASAGAPRSSCGRSKAPCPMRSTVSESNFPRSARRASRCGERAGRWALTCRPDRRRRPRPGGHAGSRPFGDDHAPGLDAIVEVEVPISLRLLGMADLTSWCPSSSINIQHTPTRFAPVRAIARWRVGCLVLSWMAPLPVMQP